MVVGAESPPRHCWTLWDCLGSLLWTAMLVIVAKPAKLAAFPTSLSDCQTPTGWNCSGYDDRENDLFLCDTNTCKFDGECLRIGDSVTCDCQFKCHNDYVPVCGSNGVTFRNKCSLREAACRQQSEILVVSEGSCVTGLKGYSNTVLWARIALATSCFQFVTSLYFLMRRLYPLLLLLEVHVDAGSGSGDGGT